jgi:hypothetical protein
MAYPMWLLTVDALEKNKKGLFMVILFSQILQ